MASAADHPTATVCFVGSFPPAAGGQVLINESFRRLAQEAGANVCTIDLSPLPGAATWRTRMSRVPKVIVGIPRLSALLARSAASAAYIGVAGGYGQGYDIAFASLVRLSGVRLFLHHDSYAYLVKRRSLTAALVQVVGPSATHIVLCEDMKQRLLKLYGRSLRVVVISNSTNTEGPVHDPPARTRLNTIGFISHLSRAKGVLEFLDVAERLCSTRPDVQALLAGPIEESSLAPLITKRLVGASWIKYLGPVYGEAKARFYADIDAFVFPTRYANEADPRVLNEALAYGVAIVARGRGCIESIVGGGGGAVIGQGLDFVREADALLRAWCDDPALFSSISAAALANSSRLKAEHGPRLRALIREMVSTPTPHSLSP